ncbi:MAG TPA: SAM-dependent methyltransferase [Ornithinibacter sp.]|nr:SAM-dependent methyltransferase [Ornithinibacter sp.]
MTVPWREAWHDALYGPRGFYRRAEGPAGHFTTSTHGPLGTLLAEALGGLADREGATHVVDVGCGRGELLAQLHAVRPDLRLTGVDVVDRPPSLPDAVAWLRSPGGGGLPDGLTALTDVLVVAHEWLDVVPCTVAEVVAPGRVAVLLVDPTTGEESEGGPLSADELDWCARHWPLDDLPVGARIEVGATRDAAWADLVRRVRRGTVLAVDYGHTRGDRPVHGSLTAYRSGALVDPVPDGSCDLTAHVAVDALEHDEVSTQRDALRALGLSAAPPDVALARSDPAGYLAALARSSTTAALTDPRGLGAFAWVVRRVPRA